MISKEELAQLKKLSLIQIEALPPEYREAVWGELAKELKAEIDKVAKIADEVRREKE